MKIKRQKAKGNFAYQLVTTLMRYGERKRHDFPLVITFREAQVAYAPRTAVTFFLLTYAFLITCLPGISFAQSGRKPQQKPGEQNPVKPGEAPPLRIETREVVLPLMAYDAEGKFVDDLQPKDVIVVEEGEGRQVTRVKREPANIVLIMDCSNEIGTFKNAPTERYYKPELQVWEKGPNYQVITNPTTRKFASLFVSQLSPEDQIAIIQYSERAQLIQDWTNDREKALNSLASKYRVGIKSSYHDALKLAADKLQAQPNGRRIVVLITDGIDSNSKTGRSKAMTALEKARASVFVLGWADALRREIEIAAQWAANHEVAGTNSSKRIAEFRRHLSILEGATADLRLMAETSGGEFWLPATHNDLIASHSTISREIGAQYSLSFITERTPSLEDKRSIKVIAARPGLSVRSRSSYYIPEEPKVLTR